MWLWLVAAHIQSSTQQTQLPLEGMANKGQQFLITLLGSSLLGGCALGLDGPLESFRN